MMLYRFVDAQRAEGFPVRMVCSVVGVSPSAYYAYRHRHRSGPAQLAEAALVDEIRAIWTESGGTYGSPRVYPRVRLNRPMFSWDTRIVGQNRKPREQPCTPEQPEIHGGSHTACPGRRSVRQDGATAAHG